MFEKIRKKKFKTNAKSTRAGSQPLTSELKEFTDFTSILIDLMVDFSLLTLRIISKKKETPLSISQIEEIVNFDLQFRIQQIQDPELLDVVRERIISEYIGKQNIKTHN